MNLGSRFGRGGFVLGWGRRSAGFCGGGKLGSRPSAPFSRPNGVEKIGGNGEIMAEGTPPDQLEVPATGGHPHHAPGHREALLLDQHHHRTGTMSEPGPADSCRDEKAQGGKKKQREKKKKWPRLKGHPASRHRRRSRGRGRRRRRRRRRRPCGSGSSLGRGSTPSGTTSRGRGRGRPRCGPLPSPPFPSNPTACPIWLLRARPPAAPRRGRRVVPPTPSSIRG